MINVIGLGYIGLPTALMLAAHGQQVVGTDLSEPVVEALNRGAVSLMEEGVEDLYRRAVERGIRFSTKYQKAEYYIIAVPTPYDAQTKQVDAGYVESAMAMILEVCPPGAVVVIESTVSPGTIEKRLRPMIQEKGFVIGADIFLAHAPERIIPGNMLYELRCNNRTVGADQQQIGLRVKELYRSFCQGEITLTDIRTAEMTKVVENTFRAVNIAFANELAKICRESGLDVYEVIDICNKHPRVKILQPGPGVGGHCISVDPWFLVGDYPSLTDLTTAAMRTNARMPRFVLERIRQIMDEHGLEDMRRVGLYGLAYKANVDDSRESPGLQLQQVIQSEYGCCLRCYDPYIKGQLLPQQHQGLDAFLEGLELVVVLVGHTQLRSCPEKLQGKLILDCCNLPELSGAHHL